MKQRILPRLYFAFSLICMMCLTQLWLGCSTPPDTNTAVVFSQVYKDVIKPSCAFQSCHGGGAGGLNLKEENAYDALVNADSNKVTGQKLVIPNDAANSLFLKILKEKIDLVRRMPPAEALPQEKIDIVEKWISQGAKKE